jgi:nitrite reductase/ring-hydroxylating ferredoxin subunit
MDLCALDELEPGVVREFVVGRLPVGVVRVGDGVRVFNSICPHKGGPIGKRGRVRRRITSDCPGKIDVLEGESPVLTCPWHNWEFDLDTGQALYDRSTRVRLYDSDVVDGRVVAYVRG